MKVSLIRFWFEFEAAGIEKDWWYLKLGCGVTAWSYEDAVHLPEKNLFKEKSFPPIKKVIENLDVSTLESNHVLPNIVTQPNMRGIWYPQGLNEI